MMYISHNHQTVCLQYESLGEKKSTLIRKIKRDTFLGTIFTFYEKILMPFCANVMYVSFHLLTTDLKPWLKIEEKTDNRICKGVKRKTQSELAEFKNKIQKRINLKGCGCI